MPSSKDAQFPGFAAARACARTNWLPYKQARPVAAAVLYSVISSRPSGLLFHANCGDETMTIEHRTEELWPRIEKTPMPPGPPY
ncbi:hypothetical protein IE4872_PA00039 (plasmid) [Rhizobium gallicum]|uniref:Uncharacterized protein n=1 Tax=Rhizobium gallicum TaxID=56730 RepID=A0A1L5NPH7_9HYPH|nr:hypothetical protein IE4872_PA00039 [Rhizobium gallicum]